MKTTRLTILTLVTALGLAGTPGVAGAASDPTDLPPGVRPVPGLVVTRFDPPEITWGTGHRGVDLEGARGELVAAAADGTITYAGVLAGRGVVVVDHGLVRTTYEPVAATVAVGEVVSRGQPIGRLLAGHPSCPTTTCLHWGLREGDDYLDPLLLLGATIRLLPASATPDSRRPVAGSLAAAALVRPAAGPVTSPYGMRRHPTTGVWKLHDGTDFGAACGSPIRAAASGTVVSVSVTSAWGNRLVLDHGGSPTGRLMTAYNHAQAYSVGVGDHVAAGQVVGSVGRTGIATGCHLHFQVWANGLLVDPMSVLP